MKSAGEALRLILAAGMIVYYFAAVLPGIGPLPSSPPLVAMYWVVIAALIAPSAAKFFSEKLVGSVFSERKGKASREYSKAKSLAAQGRFQEAIEEFRRGLEQDPDNVMLRLEIAEIYSREMKDFRRAIEELEKCLELRLGETQGASILNRIADIYETNLGSVEAVASALMRIQEKWPGTKVASRAQERIRAIGGQMKNRD